MNALDHDKFFKLIRCRCHFGGHVSDGWSYRCSWLDLGSYRRARYLPRANLGSFDWDR